MGSSPGPAAAPPAGAVVPRRQSLFALRLDFPCRETSTDADRCHYIMRYTIIVAVLRRESSHIVVKRSGHAQIGVRPQACFAVKTEVRPNQGAAVNIVPEEGIRSDAGHVDGVELKAGESLEKQIVGGFLRWQIRSITE